MVMKYLLPIGLVVLFRIQGVRGLLQGHPLTQPRIIGHPTIKSTTVLKASSTSPNLRQKDASSGESEAEKLLRLARKLRQQAEEEEQQVHEHLYEKKQKEDEQMDQWIQNLCLNEASQQNKKNVRIVNQLKDRRPCMETLERIVDRLHEHHLIASGHECVEIPSFKKQAHHNGVQRVHHEKDDDLAHKIEIQAEALFDAVDTVDDELHHDHYHEDADHHADAESRHWGGDQRAKQLRDRWHALLREHEEQFLKRQASFIEAQTIKKNDNLPPPKVKDDHGLLP